MTATTDAGASRVAWIDSGRGLAISLVVLLHVTMWLEVVGVTGENWTAVNDCLASLRLPLFFAASGLLGSSWVLRRAWADLVPRKVLFLVWAYLVWQPLYSLTAVLQAELTGDVLTPLRMVVSLGLSPVRPRFELWFLWSLALFFVVGRALAHRWVWAQFAVAGLVSAFFLTADVVTGNLGWDGTAKYYLFFLVGVYHREALLRFGRTLGTVAAVALVGAWAVIAFGAHQAGLMDVFGVSLVVRSVGLLAGIALAGLTAPLRVLTHLGANTLPIYVAHIPAVAVVVWLVSHVDAEWPGPVLVLLPLLLTVLVLSSTLALYEVLGKPLRYLYEPPAFVTALVSGWFPADPNRGRHAGSGVAPPVQVTLPVGLNSEASRA